MYVNHSVQRTPVKAPVVTRLLWLGRATITLGLAAYLTGKTNRVDDVIQTTEATNLDVVCCGPPPAQPSELLGSQRMVQLMQELSRRYDRVILDCPPVSAVSDPLILSAMADAVSALTAPCRLIKSGGTSSSRIFASLL